MEQIKRKVEVYKRLCEFIMPPQGVNSAGWEGGVAAR